MNVLATARALLVRIGFLAGRWLPLRSRVVLATAHAERIGGNLRWIGDGLRRDMPAVPVVELAHRAGGIGGYAGAALHAIRSGFQLATARLFIVDDYFFPMYVIQPRPGTTRVQVWHACGAFKKFGYSVRDKAFGADDAYARAVDIHSNYDTCLVSAARFIPAYSEAFGLPPERFTASIGVPRTDFFFDAERMAAAASNVRARYAIPAGRRVVLYAPTFRSARTTSARDPRDLDVAALATALGPDQLLLVRSHPFVRSPAWATGSGPDAVIDVSGHPDINELMLVSDVLVTDYSSAIFEYALLGRPMAFFAPDHAAYEAERGFYFDYATGLPGPIFTTIEDLAAWLRMTPGTADLERVRQFAAQSFDAADGQATARFLQQIVVPALGTGAHRR